MTHTSTYGNHLVAMTLWQPDGCVKSFSASSMGDEPRHGRREHAERGVPFCFFDPATPDTDQPRWWDSLA